jgi:hypothetical protein
VSYSSSDKVKRSTSLVANGTASTGCFGGLIQCSTVDDMDCDSDSDSSLSDLSSGDDSCPELPAVFYNCDYLGGNRVIPNLNENTQAASPSTEFIGICENIKNYLNSVVTTTPSGVTVVKGSNWMQLTYLKGGITPEGTNRGDACSAVSVACAATKSAMWPTAVYNAATDGGVYKTMAGYSDTLSCDEFPFNT